MRRIMRNNWLIMASNWFQLKKYAVKQDCEEGGGRRVKEDYNTLQSKFPFYRWVYFISIDILREERPRGHQIQTIYVLKLGPSTIWVSSSVTLAECLTISGPWALIRNRYQIDFNLINGWTLLARHEKFNNFLHPRLMRILHLESRDKKCLLGGQLHRPGCIMP